MTISYVAPETVQTSPSEYVFTTSSRGELYARPVTIQHWQLRDLIYYGQDDNVYCVYSHQTIAYDPKTRRSSVVQDLNFHPTSFCVGHGYIAAGGQSSQLAVMDLVTREQVFSGPLGGNVNNALHIAKAASGQLLLFACNNDNTVKAYRLPSMEVAHSIRFKHPINYCSLSPDGLHLVCVSDDRKTEVLALREGSFDRVATLVEAQDAGMSCAWNPTGTCFAAASQDGRLCVWDFKTSRLVAKFSSRGACRNVKFSPGPIDLMAYTDHENSFHIVDARNFGARQTITLGTQGDGRDGIDITGLAFTGDGSRLYVGTERGLCAFDIDTVKRRGFEHGLLI